MYPGHPNGYNYETLPAMILRGSHVLLLAVLVLFAPWAEGAEHVVDFDIPQQRADRALIRFAEQSNLTLVFAYEDTRRISTNALLGSYSVVEGLEILLDGTGLRISTGSDGNLSVVPSAADASNPSLLQRVGNAIGSLLSVPDDVPEDSMSDGLLEEIFVRARKREELLQDIPTSAAALPRRLLDDLNAVEGLRGLTDLIPGITINDVNLHFLSEPSIRGGGAGRNRMSASATGLYRNGAYIASAGPGGKNFSRMDYFDLERAEVLRGPQGALYGRNALGGSINLVSRKPQERFEADLGIRLGELDMRRFDATVNIPVSDAIFFRVGRVKEDRDDGFYRDVHGGPVDTVDYDHTRLGLRWHPNSLIDATWTYDTQDHEWAPTIRITSSALALTGSEFDTLINTEHHDLWQTDNHNLAIEAEVGGGTLALLSNWRERFVEAVQDSDYYLPSLQNQHRSFVQSSDSKLYFQEIRYGLEGDRFSWLVGADYHTFENHDVIDLTRGFPRDTPLDLWVRTIGFGVDSWALFGSIEYSLKHIPLTLTGELRAAWDKLRGSLTQVQTLVAPPVVMRDFTIQDAWSNVPFGVTASYRFADLDALLYLKLASSYRHGGMNDGPGNPRAKFAARLSYDDERNQTWELGWKSTLMEGSLLLSVAAFTGKYKDFIAGTDDGCPEECQLIDGDGNPLGFDQDGRRVGADANDVPIPPNEEIPRTAFMDNVGAVELWGYEAESAYRMRLPDGGSIRFRLALSRQLGEVRELDANVSQALSRRALGARLVFTRPTQVKAQAVFKHPLGRGLDLLMSGSYVYESGGYWGLGDVPDTKIDESNPAETARRFNARIGIESRRWSAILSGQNVTDRNYKIWHDAAEPATIWRRIPPRYWQLELTYRLP